MLNNFCQADSSRCYRTCSLITDDPVDNCYVGNEPVSREECK